MNKREQSILSQFEIDPQQDDHVIVPVSIPIEEAILLDEAQRQDEGKGLPFRLSTLAFIDACEFARSVVEQEHSDELRPIVEDYSEFEEERGIGHRSAALN